MSNVGDIILGFRDLTRHDIMGYALEPKSSYLSNEKILSILRRRIYATKRASSKEILQRKMQIVFLPSKPNPLSKEHSMQRLRRRETLQALFFVWISKQYSLSENSLFFVRKEEAGGFREKDHIWSEVGKKTKGSSDSKSRGRMCVLRGKDENFSYRRSRQRERVGTQEIFWPRRFPRPKSESVPRYRETRVSEGRVSGPVLQLQHGEASSWGLPSQGGF